MDYEQKYKEALGRAKEYNFDGAKQVVKDLVTYIFPELKESEDERIRKWLIDWVNAVNWSERFSVTKEQVFAWLEKKKPTLSKGDEEHLNNAIWACLHEYGKDSDTAEWLKSLVEQL